MKKTTVLLNVLLVCMFTLSACAPTAVAEPANEPVMEPTELQSTVEPTDVVVQTAIVITDDLGTEIVLAEPAQKIISISPSLTEILFSVGAGDRLIGRDSNSTYPEEALSAVDLGGMWDGIPVEDILAHGTRPDTGRRDLRGSSH